MRFVDQRTRTNLSPKVWLLFFALAAVCFNACSTADTDEALTEPSLTTLAPAEVVPSSAPTTVPAPTTTVEQTDPFEVHLSPDGNDGAAGTDSSPVQTFEQALSLVAPGGSVVFHAGTYPPITVSERNDLTLRNRENDEVTIVGGGFTRNSGILISDSVAVTVDGLDVTQVLWGIWIERSSSVTIVRSEVFELGQEGIVVKKNSNAVDIIDNVIHSTGLRPGESTRPYSDFGEGIYIGNAGALDDGTWDQTNNIRIAGNHIFNTTAEAIDVKPWANNITIESNLVHDVRTATSGAIVVGIGELVTDAGDVTIRGNVIHSITRTSPFRDGNAIVVSSPATVVGNVIWNVQHFGILVDRLLGTSSDGSVVVQHNLVISAGAAPIDRHDNQEVVSVSVTDNETGPQAVEFATAALGEFSDFPLSEDAEAEAWSLVAELLERHDG